MARAAEARAKRPPMCRPRRTPAVGPESCRGTWSEKAVIVATIVSTVLLFGLIFADVLTDRALARGFRCAMPCRSK